MHVFQYKPLTQMKFESILEQIFAWWLVYLVGSKPCSYMLL